MSPKSACSRRSASSWKQWQGLQQIDLPQFRFGTADRPARRETFREFEVPAFDCHGIGFSFRTAAESHMPECGSSQILSTLDTMFTKVWGKQ